MDFFSLSFQVFIPVIFKGGASLVAQLVKNPPANAGDTRDVGSIPGSGRSLGVGYGNPLQCSYLAEGGRRGWGKVEEADKILGSLSSCMWSDLPSQQPKTR